MEYRKLKDLTELSGNPRKIDKKQFEILLKSLAENKEYFEARPLILSNRTGKLVIIAGNQRFKGAKHLKMVECPTFLIKGLTEAKEREIIIRDNVSNGEWDWEVLGKDWGVTDLAEWGVVIPDFNKVDLKAEEDDFVIPDKIKTNINLGDLIEIGKHRLICGDSTNEEVVKKLMNGKRGELVFTDPPYGIDYSGGRTQTVKKKTYGKLLNDDLKGEELGKLISNIFKFNTKDADVYVCVSPIMQKPFLDFIHSSKREINAVIVWDKKQPGIGYMAYRRQCEFILFIKGGPFKKTDISDFDLWSISRDNAKDYQHGTQKPVAVPGRAITNSSKKGGIVLDYFLGSGSTMVACEQLGRICYAVELSTEYCQVIINRMLNLVPNIAVRINGKQYKIPAKTK